MFGKLQAVNLKAMDRDQLFDYKEELVKGMDHIPAAFKSARNAIKVEIERVYDEIRSRT